jgi:hypothetical protein
VYGILGHALIGIAAMARNIAAIPVGGGLTDKYMRSGIETTIAEYKVRRLQ